MVVVEGFGKRFFEKNGRKFGRVKKELYICSPKWEVFSREELGM